MKDNSTSQSYQNVFPRPPVKWAGGKKQLLGELLARVPCDFATYVEPFFGGGALYFALLPPKAVIADLNGELINAYEVIRDRTEELIIHLQAHRNEKDYFYSVRDYDPARLSALERASRFIFLNKTCYNGLYRVNSRSKFNVPFGRYRNPKICDAGNLLAVAAALKNAEILQADFEQALARADSHSFVYLDPPYSPLSPTANFTKYTSNDFGAAEQKRLARVFRELDRRGSRVLLSNSDTPLIRELYQGYAMETVRANRPINCKSDGRKPVAELLIRNYNDCAPELALQGTEAPVQSSN